MVQLGARAIGLPGVLRRIGLNRRTWLIFATLVAVNDLPLVRDGVVFLRARLSGPIPSAPVSEEDVLTAATRNAPERMNCVDFDLNTKVPAAVEVLAEFPSRRLFGLMGRVKRFAIAKLSCHVGEGVVNGFLVVVSKTGSTVRLESLLEWDAQPGNHDTLTVEVIDTPATSSPMISVLFGGGANNYSSAIISLYVFQETSLVGRMLFGRTGMREVFSESDDSNANIIEGSSRVCSPLLDELKTGPANRFLVRVDTDSTGEKSRSEYQRYAWNPFRRRYTNRGAVDRRAAELILKRAEADAARRSSSPGLLTTSMTIHNALESEHLLCEGVGIREMDEKDYEGWTIGCPQFDLSVSRFKTEQALRDSVTAIRALQGGESSTAAESPGETASMYVRGTFLVIVAPESAAVALKGVMDRLLPGGVWQQVK